MNMKKIGLLALMLGSVQLHSMDYDYVANTFKNITITAAVATVAVAAVCVARMYCLNLKKTYLNNDRLAEIENEIDGIMRQRLYENIADYAKSNTDKNEETGILDFSQRIILSDLSTNRPTYKEIQDAIDADIKKLNEANKNLSFYRWFDARAKELNASIKNNLECIKVAKAYFQRHEDYFKGHEIIQDTNDMSDNSIDTLITNLQKDGRKKSIDYPVKACCLKAASSMAWIYSNEKKLMLYPDLYKNLQQKSTAFDDLVRDLESSQEFKDEIALERDKIDQDIKIKNQNIKIKNSETKRMKAQAALIQAWATKKQVAALQQTAQATAQTARTEEKRLRIQTLEISGWSQAAIHRQVIIDGIFNGIYELYSQRRI